VFYTVSDLFDLAQTEHGALLTDCEYPWDPLKRLVDYLSKHVQPIQKHRVIGRAYIGEQVSLGEGTIVEDGAMILGPAIIGKNCRIRHNAYIRENVVIGDNCLIGNACEVKHAILFNGAQVPHFNYVGDSILGHKVHLGAGAILSNIKLAPEEIWLEMDGRCIDTGLRKLGALVGDHAQIGCNAVINPGAIIGRSAQIQPNVSWRGILPDNMIVKHRAAQEVVVLRPRGAQY
jgi:NDP-sugar pyrophosphorylase family protein